MAKTPVFMMTRSARAYAIELQGLSAHRYMRGRVDAISAMTAPWWEEDAARDVAINNQLHAAETYARFVGVMGFAD